MCLPRDPPHFGITAETGSLLHVQNGEHVSLVEVGEHDLPCVFSAFLPAQRGERNSWVERGERSLSLAAIVSSVGVFSLIVPPSKQQRAVTRRTAVKHTLDNRVDGYRCHIDHSPPTPAHVLPPPPPYSSRTAAAAGHHRPHPQQQHRHRHQHQHQYQRSTATVAMTRRRRKRLPTVAPLAPMREPEAGAATAAGAGGGTRVVAGGRWRRDSGGCATAAGRPRTSDHVREMLTFRARGSGIHGGRDCACV